MYTWKLSLHHLYYSGCFETHAVYRPNRFQSLLISSQPHKCATTCSTHWLIRDEKRTKVTLDCYVIIMQSVANLWHNTGSALCTTCSSLLRTLHSAVPQIFQSIRWNSSRTWLHASATKRHISGNSLTTITCHTDWVGENWSTAKFA